METLFNDTKDQLDILRKTVAIGATESEFSMFLALCRSTGLNPYKREVWFVKAGGRAQIMTGINGFRAIANANGEYDGTELGLIGPGGEYLPATYPKDDFIGAWAKCHRKDRKIPAEGIAMVAEYDKKFGNWKTMRRVMILKCAESVALRAAFPQQLNGLYTTEEMPREFSETPAATEVAIDKKAVELATSPEAHKILTKCKFAGWEVSKIDETDPTWISDVLADPVKANRLQAIDRVALIAFQRQVSQSVARHESIVDAAMAEAQGDTAINN